MENYESCYFINHLHLFIINYVLVFYLNVAISFEIFPAMIITFVKVFSQFRNLKIFVILSTKVYQRNIMNLCIFGIISMHFII